MLELPIHFERARELAAGRSPEPADARRVDALRRALAEVFGEQVPLMAKVLADGRVDADERAALDEATSRLARYYGLALSFDGGEELGAALQGLRASIEEQARALAIAAKGDQPAARAAWEEAGRRLASIPASRNPGDPGTIHAAAEIVYDRVTGRSKYDAESEEWLSFGLRCPSDICRTVRPYRLLSPHPTHRFECTACGAPFLVFVATALQAERTARHSTATHRVLAKGADGVEHAVIFDHLLEEGADFEIRPGDLVLLTYDVGGKLKLVRNYTRGRETTVHVNGRCFVATVAAGPSSPEVRALRRYRDEVLLRRRTGRLAVVVYDLVGPPLADILERSSLARRAARWLVRLAARLSGMQRTDGP